MQLIVIVRALDGFKSSGAAWCSHLANALQIMVFRSRLADPDVWMHPAVKPNGDKYYEYLLAQVNDILAISHDPSKILLHLSDFHRQKDGFDKPTHYLSAQVKDRRFPNEPLMIQKNQIGPYFGTIVQEKHSKRLKDSQRTMTFKM